MDFELLAGCIKLRRVITLSCAAQEPKGQNLQGGRMVPVEHHRRQPVTSSGCNQRR